MAEVAYSHLFPGVVIEAHDHTDEFDLRFADGSRAPAALHTDDTGGYVLEVGTYVTAAGTEISERLWTVRSMEPHHDGRRIKLGPAFP
ncbi:hypothetical protein IU485_25990 [Nocardia cyriacigeorgica]|uniref:hypothetical protein n=1 Tax=Nocardia cyriacigeorgica TaxID=135487 RepID=UPI00189482F4|nr:hypothetical protein [Nocardia cyriacigeorgica]MBF6084830.1 hypothetical protein [Nocardia cyriacigeorgica]BDT86820.1 hypothetical protein FMUAM8_25840 [Nocardia cyriacigeorgica]